MKTPRLALSITLLLIAGVAEAQMQFRTTPAYGMGTDRTGFSLGPRYSNYSTDVDVAITTIESGRQHSFGLVGDYRSGVFVLDFGFDHDPENGLSLSDLLPFETANYERDRAEFTVGWAALPVLDLQAGFRHDSFTVGGDVFGGGFFSAESLTHSGIVVGVNVHTPTRQPFGLYGTARALIGSMEFDDIGTSQDSMGWRAEAGVEIPIGDSQWHAVPGFEIEHIEADNLGVNIDTNRFFVNFVYSFR